MRFLRKLAGSFWARGLVSVGLLALIATQVDFSRGVHRLADGRWEWFALATVVIIATSAIASFRWHLYLEACDVDHRGWRQALRAYFVGTFTSNFLPSQVGGDVARALIVGKRGTRIRAFTTVVIDRVTGLACLIVVTWVFVAANPGDIPRSLLVTLVVVSSVFAMFVVVVLGIIRFRDSIRRRLPERLRSFAGETLSALRSSIKSEVLLKTLSIGILFQALGVLAAWLIGRSIDLPVPASTLVTSLPLVLVLSFLPFSIGGLGIREGGYVVLLGQAGVSATEATVFSLLNGLAVALASLPGLLVLLRGGSSGVRETAPTPLSD
ncbi:MAG: lysylphosphatidylglycerol synthase transmembrane domain-containing protein [Gaiellaceae bacterium]